MNRIAAARGNDCKIIRNAVFEPVTTGLGRIYKEVFLFVEKM